MTYGSVHPTTRNYLMRRAHESGIPFEKLGIDPELPEDDVDLPDNCYTFSVIYDGALDEEFSAVTDYEINIADWVAETCREEAKNNQESEFAGWEVIVAEFADTGVVRYRVSDEGGA